MKKCIGCHYYDSKEKVCTHGSPIFIDDTCTDFRDSEFVELIRTEAIEEVKKELIDIIQGNEQFIDWQKEEICICVECAIENVLEQKGE